MQQRLRIALLAIALSTAQSCYHYVPLTTSPSAGEVVVFQITDQGRVGLSDRFGPGLMRIEGMLTAVKDSVFLVEVHSIDHIDGSSARWSNESIRLLRAYVGTMQGRQFDRTRTTVLASTAAVATGGIIAGLIAKGLFGGYSGPTTIDTTVTTQKGRIPVLRPPIRP